jgi:hypothetical protein
MPRVVCKCGAVYYGWALKHMLCYCSKCHTLLNRIYMNK